MFPFRPVDDFRGARFGISSQQPDRRHDHPRHTIPALRGPLLDERFLHRMQVTGWREPFDRFNRVVFDLIDVVWHEVTGLPSTSTVQARHWPSPQPYFVPVRPRSSRRTSSSVRRRSGRNACGFPFRVNCTVAFMGIADGCAANRSGSTGAVKNRIRPPWRTQRIAITEAAGSSARFSNSARETRRSNCTISGRCFSIPCCT